MNTFYHLKQTNCNMSSIKSINHNNIEHIRISGRYYEDQNDYSYIANTFSFYSNIPIVFEEIIFGKYKIVWTDSNSCMNTLK